MLDPVPVSDTNINAEDFEDGVEVEDESTTRREGHLSYLFVRVLFQHQHNNGCMLSRAWHVSPEQHFWRP